MYDRTQGNAKNDSMTEDRTDVLLIGVLGVLAFLCTLIIILLCIVLYKRLGNRRCEGCRHRNHHTSCNLCSGHAAVSPNQQSPYWLWEEEPSTTRRRPGANTRFNPVYVPDEPERSTEVTGIQRNSNPRDEVMQPPYSQDEGRQPRFPRDEGRQPRYPEDEGRQPRFPNDEGRQPRYPEDEGRQPRWPEDEVRQPRYPQDGGRQPRCPQDEGRQHRYPQDEERQPDMDLSSVHSHNSAFSTAWMNIKKVVDRSVTAVVGDKLVVYITRRIGYNGGFLVLDNMGISVEVPPGAVNEGETKIITLLLNWDLTDNPFMQPNQALVSPVVFVGPHGIKLNKPCILSYMHCSFDTRHIQVMKSETDLFSQKKWEVMCTPNSKSEACVLTSSTCQLNIDTFTLYTCLQCPPEGELGRKWLQVAVFSEGIKQGIENQQIRVYFLNKTNCALQWAINNEAKYGSKLICPEKLFLLEGTEKDVFVVLKHLSRGWTMIDQTNSRLNRIQYLSIWHGLCPHVCVGFRRENPSMYEFSLYLDVQQDGRENESERIIAQIVQQEPENTAGVPRITPVPTNRTIPQCLRTRLQVLLDVSCPLARNWKGLAERLGYDAMIPMIESRTIGSSPTEMLLQVIEQKAHTLQDLQRFLGEMGRTDAVNAIQEYFEPPEEHNTTPLKPCREAVENENSAIVTSDHRLNDF
ncbi:UNC5C-like protein [Ylistrum balloti]|uniref:UNC5C-like protein n=1 Tax=Ylistrum balloti TaxID=509963 RepID=UPI002905EB52|nr:UNC5C-like protein [Ylistrum balloti]